MILHICRRLVLMWISVCSLPKYHTRCQRFFRPTRTRQRTFRHLILTCQQTICKHNMGFKSPIKPTRPDRRDNEVAVRDCGKPFLPKHNVFWDPIVEKCDPVLISVLLQIDRRWYKYETKMRHIFQSVHHRAMATIAGLC